MEMEGDVAVKGSEILEKPPIFIGGAGRSGTTLLGYEPTNKEQ